MDGNANTPNDFDNIENERLSAETDAEYDKICAEIQASIEETPAEEVDRIVLINQEAQTVRIENEEYVIPYLNKNELDKNGVSDVLNELCFKYTGRRFYQYTATASRYSVMPLNYPSEILTRKLIKSFKELKSLTDTGVLTVEYCVIPENLPTEDMEAERYAELTFIRRTDVKRYNKLRDLEAIRQYKLAKLTGKLNDRSVEDFERDFTLTNPFMTDKEWIMKEHIAKVFGASFETIKESEHLPAEHNENLRKYWDTIKQELSGNHEDFYSILASKAKEKGITVNKVGITLLSQREKAPEQKAPEQNPESKPRTPDEQEAYNILHPYANRKPKKKVKYNSRLNEAYSNEYILFKPYLEELLDCLSAEFDYYTMLRQNPEKRKSNAGRYHTTIHDQLFCNIDRVNCGLTTRGYTGSDNAVLALTFEYVNHVPSFNSLGEFVANPKLTPLLQALLQISASPLAFCECGVAIDSSGFKTLTYGEWYRIKYERELRKTISAVKRKGLTEELRKELKIMKQDKMQIWKKAHISVGERTGVIIAMRVTKNKGEQTSDASQFAPLLVDSTKYFDVCKVTADRGYSGRPAYKVAEELGITLYCPFKKGSSPRAKGVKMWADMYELAEEDPEEFTKQYTTRNKVEATFGAIKKQLGEELLGKTDNSQINELYLKAISYNIRQLAKFGTVMQRDFHFYDKYQEMLTPAIEIRGTLD